MDTELTTARLMLRRARPSDLDAFHALVSDFAVVRNTGTWPFPADRAFTATRCAPLQTARGMAGPVFHQGALVGWIGLSVKEARPELGYMFARAHWGRGFATEIGRALIAHSWQTHDWAVIDACTFSDNPGSARVLEKLGFTEGPACEGDCKARGGRFATRTFTLTRPQRFSPANPPAP